MTRCASEHVRSKSESNTSQAQARITHHMVSIIPTPPPLPHPRLIPLPALFSPASHFLPPPPRYPPLSVSVHPLGSSFFPSLSSSFGSNPGSPLSALFIPSLLDRSPTPPRIPPEERVPPTPSATPLWMALMFLSPVRSVESLSVGGRVSGLEGRGRRGKEGEGEGRIYLWLCRRFCSRPSIRGLCLRSRACSLCRLRCTSSSSTRS